MLGASEKSASYLIEEKDPRGYVEGKGPSIAHGADMLASAISHPSFRLERAEQFLTAIGECLLHKDAIYIDGEDERLLYIVQELIKKDLPEEQLSTWVGSLISFIDEKEKEGYSLESFYLRKNVSNFLKALYFRLYYLKMGSEVQRNIEEFLHKGIYA
ncbi:DUF2785 domain-containing protein [Peribacillus kribbensis]|uniref:DUF2785 domain-containing protein n=1 Tax=Peribacillus kribbensis TaxID=356658 RepID=UPI000403179A|nr:DUF2785 domain-containing protein [Peribacillus kribbensis]